MADNGKMKVNNQSLELGQVEVLDKKQLCVDTSMDLKSSSTTEQLMTVGKKLKSSEPQIFVLAIVGYSAYSEAGWIINKRKDLGITINKWFFLLFFFPK